MRNLLEGDEEEQFTAEQYMMLYTYAPLCSLFWYILAMLQSTDHLHDFACRTIYNMCTQKPPHDYSEQLYNRYRESFSVYIKDKVSLLCLKSFSVGCLSTYWISVYRLSMRLWSTTLVWLSVCENAAAAAAGVASS